MRQIRAGSTGDMEKLMITEPSALARELAAIIAQYPQGCTMSNIDLAAAIRRPACEVAYALIEAELAGLVSFHFVPRRILAPAAGQLAA